MNEQLLQQRRRTLLARRLAAARAVDEPLLDSSCPTLGKPSRAQEALWFLELDPQTEASYNIHRSWRLRGAVHTDTLQKSLHALCQRHDALRTVFQMHDGSLHTLTTKAAVPDFRVEDLSAIADDQRLEALARERRKTINKKFDLSAGPLVRVRLYHLQPHESELVLVIHHIVADGWSLRIIESELSALYRQAASSDSAPLAVAPSFRNWTHQQRIATHSETRKEQLQYWQTQLKGLNPLPLPFDRPRSNAKRTEAGHEPFTLDRNLVLAMKSLARAQGATLYMVLLSAFQLLLMRHCGVSDVAVGTPVAGRSHRAQEHMVGYFVNVLVLRSDLSGTPSFVQLLARVKKNVLDGLAHQTEPFERLVSLLRPQRDANMNPLFQVALTLHNLPSGGLDLPAVEAQPTVVVAGAAKFDLALAFTEQQDGSLQGSFEYEPALFNAASVHRMGEHLRTLLRDATHSPDTSVLNLELNDNEERQRLLTASSARCPHIERESNLATRFEAQVEKTPKAVAISHGQKTQTYAELNVAANRLAHWLKTSGVEHGDKVALGLSRGMNFVTAVLALSKLGAAYIPLDEQHLTRRLNAILNDARPKVLLIDETASADCTQITQLQVLHLQLNAKKIAAMPSFNLACNTSADDLAYVIFTSGSTGEPKGVMISQRAVLALCLDADYVVLNHTTNIALASNVAFDATTFEIWGALLNGGRITVIEQDELLDSLRLAEKVRDEAITTLFLTTELFNLHAANAPPPFQGLRELLFGGEAADPKFVLRVLEQAPPKRLINMYGPTETTTFASCYEVDTESARRLVDSRSRVPIGKPITNTTVQVRDRWGQPAPIGVIGELYIGGAGVADGYLGRPELTSQRFVNLTQSEQQSVDAFPNKWFRTGDLVRWNDSALLEYVGRNDDQIKLRGYRIEPGEIERCLRGTPGVVSAVAWVRKHSSAGSQLVAAVSRATNAEVTLGQRARDRARKFLPSYMIPVNIFVLDEMPITANGKVDRQRIELQCSQEPVESQSKAKQLADHEAKMIALWTRLLGIENIQLSDDFFDLGGYSLLGVRLLAEVEREFGIRLPMSAIFEAPTPNRLLTLCSRSQEPGLAKGLVGIKPSGNLPPLFFVSGFGGELMGLRTVAEALGTDRPLMVLDPGAFGAECLRTETLEQTATRLCNAMRSVQPAGPYYLAGYSLGGKYVYEIAQQLKRANSEIGMLCLLDCNAPGYPPPRPWRGRIGLYAERLSGAHNLHQATSRIAHYLLFHLGRKLSRRRIFNDAAEEMEALPIGAAMQITAQATLHQWRRYTPVTYVGDLTLIVAKSRQIRIHIIDNDPKLGWVPLIDGQVIVHKVGGHHRSIIKPEQAGETGRVIAKLLANS